MNPSCNIKNDTLTALLRGDPSHLIKHLVIFIMPKTHPFLAIASNITLDDISHFETTELIGETDWTEQIQQFCLQRNEPPGEVIG